VFLTACCAMYSVCPQCAHIYIEEPLQLAA
jgi:hypothetical protein